MSMENHHSWVPAATAARKDSDNVDGVNFDSGEGECSEDELMIQEVSSLPIITNEEERRERQQMSSHEILGIESDLRGITVGMDAMSIASAGGESSGVGIGCSTLAGAVLGPAARNGDEQGPFQQQQEQPSLSWRNDDEIQRDLNLLNEELQRIPALDKAAYLTAIQRCPDEAFGGWKWDAFLEERDYDAKRTAKNLIEYWNRRLALFGEDRCYLPMTLAGAMQDEVPGMTAYCVGLISPVKDSAGRTVMISRPSRRVRSLYTTDSLSKAFWYMLEVVAQDPEARRCGVVLLLNGKNARPSTFDPTFDRYATSIIRLFPFSWRAAHFININTLTSRILLPVLKLLMPRGLRQRLIIHTGSTVKLIEDMKTYSLPPDRLPKEFGGEVVVDMQAWINERYAKEGSQVAESNQAVVPIVEPSNKRVRREASAVDSSLDLPSFTQQPEDQHVPSPSIPISDVQMTEEEEILVGHTTGRKADPRMNNAIILKLRNPKMESFDVLIAAGFNYALPTNINKKEKEMLDEEGISLRQRKDNLRRRLKQLKSKREKVIARKQQQQPANSKRNSSSITERTTYSQECNSQEELVEDLAPEIERDDASEDSFYERILELPGLDGLENMELQEWQSDCS